MTTEYQKQLVKWQARRERAAELHAKGYTHAEIGRMLRPKVSKQAVGKLLRKAALA